MLNLIHADLYKLRRSIGFKVCLLLTWVCAIGFVYVSHCLAVGKISINVVGSASGLSDAMVIWLFVPLITGILVCNDFETKTIHDSVICGRLAIVLSKAAVYFIAVVLIVLPYAVAAIVGFCSGEKFALFMPSVFLSILAKAGHISLTANAVSKIIVLCLIEMIVYAASISICLPIAFKTKKPIIVTGIGFGFGALIAFIGSLVKNVDILKDIYKCTPYAMGVTSLTMKAGAGILLKASVISIVFFSIMVIITYVMFRKAEIK